MASAAGSCSDSTRDINFCNKNVNKKEDRKRGGRVGGLMHDVYHSCTIIQVVMGKVKCQLSCWIMISRVRIRQTDIVRNVDESVGRSSGGLLHWYDVTRGAST